MASSRTQHRAARIPGAARAILLLAVVLGMVGPRAAADPPQPPGIGQAGPRSGSTNRFGSGTVTRRSDGSNAQTRPFGSGSTTTERRSDGRTVTGRTQPFGSGTVTRWSDGTRTTTRPFGSGTITEERGRDGRTVTGRTQSFGSGTVTRRSDGSTSRTQPFGSGTIQRDQPGRKPGR